MRGLRLGGSGVSKGELGRGLGPVAPGALVGLAGLYGQESQHRGVLPELHATLCGEAHIFSQVINSSWEKRKEKLLEISYFSPILLSVPYRSIKPSTHIYTHPFIYPHINLSIQPAS